MKAVVFRGIGDIRIEEVPEPKIQKPTDAVVRLTANAICGTDLHMVRGTLPGLEPGTILGHEGVWIVEEIGSAVRNLNVGDRVVIPSTIACGNCSYCRAGYYAQCDNANPNSQDTAFFGGGSAGGGYQGLQAEKARIPFANVGLVKLPDDVSDDEAILLSDIFPTGYMAAELAEIKPGNIVAVFGCGPVGLFAIASAKLLNAGRIFAIDTIPSRLDKARQLGAEVINFNEEDPVKTIEGFTGKIGVDRVIDAVGVDADRPHHGPAAKKTAPLKREFKQEREEIAPKAKEEGPNWHPGDAPSQVLRWAVESVAKAGTLSIVGVYSEKSQTFPVGDAVGKNLTIKGGNCHHRKYIPKLLELVRSGAVDPTEILTHVGPLTSAVEAYKEFDRREPGWIKVKLEPLSPAVAA